MKNIQIFCLSLMLGCAPSLQANRDFSTLQRFILGLPENVQSDNSDWENPSYLSFYMTLKRSWVDVILHKFNLAYDNPWDLKYIQELLSTSVESRKKFVEKGSYVAHMLAKPETKFVIWGDLFGAVHSLFRDLDYLYRNGVIDNQLRIIKPDHYFIFLGNAVDRSPYSLETLQIILVLLERNPDRVFYVQGKHEHNNYWHNFNLREEVAQYFGGRIVYKADLKNLEKLLTDFFASLPGAFYINQKDGTHNVIALSNDLENYELDLTYLEHFFMRDMGTIEYLSAGTKSDTKGYNLAALIKGGEGIKTVSYSRGLRMISPFKGATVWSLVSCPVPVYQQFFNLFYDAFIVVSLERSIMDARLSLVNQDIRNQQGFTVHKAVNLITGEAISSITSKVTDFVGSTMALTKSLQYMGQDVRFSMFNTINDSNVHNDLPDRFVRVTILDDEYAPSLALKNVDRLLKDYQTNTLLLPIGSPTLEAYLSLVKEGAVNVIFPVTGSPDFRKADLKHIIHWRASYPDEARALIEHMVTENAVKRFAFFYQNDSYGIGALQEAHAVLKEKGITEWVDVPYNKTSLNFSEAVQAIKKAQPEAIGLFAIPSAAEALFRELGVEQLFNKRLFGLSFIADETFRTFVKDHGIKVLFAQVVPNPVTSDLAIVKEFRAFADKHDHDYTVFALEGYICTKLYLEALKALPAQDATAEKIIDYFASFKDFAYKGLTMTFNPEHRDLGQSVWLEAEANTWKEYKAKQLLIPKS